MTKQKFVVIEQAEDGEAYISFMECEDIEEVYDNYQTMESGNFVVITEEAFKRIKGGKL